jgi:hypothetical protein
MDTESIAPQSCQSRLNCEAERNPLPAPTASHLHGESPHHLAVSPSLRPRTRGELPAFEMKYLLDESNARRVEERLAPLMSPDPHSDPDLQNAYRIGTIYCDTPGFDVFHRVGSHRHRKYRVRQYGNESCVFLERKTKRGNRVRKVRTSIDLGNLPSLSEAACDADWHGRWFHDQFHFRRLRPACRVDYLRTAYVGADDQGPIRLTFDRDIRSTLVDGWSFNGAGDGRLAIASLVICEFKFHGVLPAIFKSAVQEFRLVPTGVSKYRHCFEAAAGAGDARVSDA